MTQSDERKILDMISRFSAQLLTMEEGVRKREVCYQMLVGCLTVLPIAINQAVYLEKLKQELRDREQAMEVMTRVFHEAHEQLSKEGIPTFGGDMILRIAEFIRRFKGSGNFDTRGKE